MEALYSALVLDISADAMWRGPDHGTSGFPA
jgi:hypothetical protein